MIVELTVKNISSLFLLFSIISGCSTIPVGYHKISDDELTNKIESIFNDSLFSYAHWVDCYGYNLVASGFAHIVIDLIMSYWDVPALIPIIKGAGGNITDYHGNNAVNAESTTAASPGIHSKVIEMLK
ncbi:MAG: hypothetical protein GY936_03910 [Ignavibacteriae bacterium]|nr:hypothetical protein [Ignavibacteriota bacterium]